MFSQIAPRYDLLNRILTLGVDQYWRKVALKLALEKRPARILDLATGTGDLALLLKRTRPDAEVVGADFAPPMLEIAKEKAKKAGLEARFLPADALNLPFADSSFDAVTIAFGLRNFTDYPKALTELYRVITPGGRLVILDFPPPPRGGLGAFYRFYFKQILPWLGGIISRNPAAYRYLPSSVERFLTPGDLKGHMQEAGFSAEYRLLSGGIVSLHQGDKPAKIAGR